MRRLIFIFLLLSGFVLSDLHTSVSSGDWNTAATWDKVAVPADGDTVTIALTHTVTLNTDYSDRTLGTITVTGTLNCCGTASAYLKTNADIVGTGQIYCGGYTDDITQNNQPLVATRSMVFDFAASAKGFNSANLDLKFYCWQPTYKYALTTSTEGTADADLIVDRDVTDWLTMTGLTLMVHVNDVDGAAESTAEQISTITHDGETEIDTVTLTNNLDSSKVTGAYVVLLTRNIRIGSTSAYAVNACKTGSVLDCEISDYTVSGGTVANGVNGGTNLTLSGSISGCTNGLIYGTTVNNSGVISNCTYGFYYGYGNKNIGLISGCTYGSQSGSGILNSGTISGCTNGIMYAHNCINSGNIIGCNRGIYISMCYLKDGTLNNTYDVSYSEIRGTGTTFSGTTENSGYLNMPYTYSYCKNYDNVAGQFKAWSGGGYVTHETSTIPSGVTHAYKHVCETVSYPCIRQEEYYVEPSKTLKVKGYIKISDDHSAYPPKIEILTLADSVLATDSIDTSDGSVTTFQTVAVEYKNTATYGQTFVIRVSAQRASGNVYEAFVVEQESGGGYRSRYN